MMFKIYGCTNISITTLSDFNLYMFSPKATPDAKKVILLEFQICKY